MNQKKSAFTTDGTSVMLGKRNGAVALLKGTLKNGGVAAEGIFLYHCTVHQEALFAKFKYLNEVMANVIEVVS